MRLEHGGIDGYLNKDDWRKDGHSGGVLEPPPSGRFFCHMLISSHGHLVPVAHLAQSNTDGTPACLDVSSLRLHRVRQVTLDAQFLRRRLVWT